MVGRDHVRKDTDETKRTGAEGGEESEGETARRKTKSKKRWRAEREEMSSFSLC